MSKLASGSPCCSDELWQRCESSEMNTMFSSSFSQSSLSSLTPAVPQTLFTMSDCENQQDLCSCFTENLPDIIQGLWTAQPTDLSYTVDDLVIYTCHIYCCKGSLRSFSWWADKYRNQVFPVSDVTVTVAHVATVCFLMRLLHNFAVFQRDLSVNSNSDRITS